ncbi:response regulator transcription factor [Dehalogenimonas sp. 4OHTPN]|uniref:Response regulator transcription factor n=1 Tax=Dehalogenimonas sp. 4OHTPN TaxID=3166643 RepID=A0AAU8G872_9CHLR
MIKVLLADDHEIVRQGVAALLNLEPDIQVIGGASGGEQALDMVYELMPDVLVTDIEMPGYSGIRLCREIRSRGLSTKCIVLSMHSAEEYVHGAFRAGAGGYVTKERSVEQLASAIRTVMRGNRYLSPHLPIVFSSLPRPC